MPPHNRTFAISADDGSCGGTDVDDDADDDAVGDLFDIVDDSAVACCYSLAAHKSSTSYMSRIIGTLDDKSNEKISMFCIRRFCVIE